MDFKLVSEYKPTGDQPEAIAQLVDSIRRGSKHNTLLGDGFGQDLHGRQRHRPDQQTDSRIEP